MIELTVTVTTMPESNGKTNHCAFLHRKNEPKQNGITIAWSEYPDRVRYEADRYRYMIGELDKKPYILDYDSNLHSGWVNPDRQILLGYTRPPHDIDEEDFHGASLWVHQGDPLDGDVPIYTTASKLEQSKQ